MYVANLMCFAAIPRILEHPKDIESRPGATAYFTCRYTSPSRTQVSWFLEGRLLDNLGSTGANSADILGDGTLVLKNVNNLASGRYSCQIQTEVNVKITTNNCKYKTEIR